MRPTTPMVHSDGEVTPRFDMTTTPTDERPRAMPRRGRWQGLVAASLLLASACKSDEGPGTQVFLLFGQSNMWGAPAPEEQDMDKNPRVEVLTLASCAAHEAGVWVTAQPPLHGCVGTMGSEPGLGPGDHFAKAVADAYPDDTILLVPNAIPGVSIDCFSPPSAGRDPGQYCGGEPGETYLAMVDRLRQAQMRGQIQGLLFHQGETDCGNVGWPIRVQEVVDSLRSDLGIGEVPFLAGEIPDGDCKRHNPRVHELPDKIANAHVVPAEDLPIYDEYHFDTPSQRILGGRYAEVFLGL